MIIGNLTRDPEMRTTTTGQNVTSFGVATSRVWKDAAGAKQEKTEFHNVVAWGKLAEICSQYLAKGRKVYVEGYLQTREWDGQDGTKRNRTEIICDNMILLDKAPQGQGGQPASRPMSPSAPQSASFVPAPAPTEDEIKVEDIPF